MDCRICHPDESRAYWSGKPYPLPGPPAVSLFYKLVPIEGITPEEMTSYLRKGKLPKNVCEKHMVEGLLDHAKELYGRLTTPEIIPNSKKLLLKRERKLDEEVSFGELADIIEIASGLAGTPEY